MLGALRYWNAVRAHSMLLKLPALLTMLKSVITAAAAFHRHSPCRNKLVNAWANFARTGNPSHSGLPRWPADGSERRATMYLDAPCHVRNDAEQDALRLIGLVRESREARYECAPLVTLHPMRVSNVDVIGSCV